MLDVKTWLESTGMKVAENHFNTPPQLPYIVYAAAQAVTGADLKPCISERDLSIELYSGKIDNEAEGKIEAYLSEKAISFKKERTWIDSERFYQTVYDFYLVEKF